MSAAAALTSGSDPNVTATGTAVVVPAPSVAVVPASTGSAIDTKWLGETPDPELKGYVENKGWPNPVELLKGYRNLEKLVGQARIAMPKDENDADGYSKVFDALGRPKAPGDYKLPTPEGADPKFVEAASKVLHEAGLSTKQAQKVATWWNESAATAQKAQAEAVERQSAQDMEQVQKEWGGAYNERVETAKRGIRVFAIDSETATKLETAIGTKAFMEFAYRLGSAVGEHGGAAGLENGGPPSGGALTPAQAIAEIARLKADREWGKKYAQGDAEAKRRMEQLHKWAYPG